MYYKIMNEKLLMRGEIALDILSPFKRIIALKKAKNILQTFAHDYAKSTMYLSKLCVFRISSSNEWTVKFC